jgi:pyrimidine 5'-nucleotidase
MQIETIFFDLDATLYPASNGLWPAIGVRIDQYMRERMGIPADETPQMRQHYYEQHGTTLRGLQIHYDIEAVDYLHYVHDLPLHEYLQPDPDLREMLLSIPRRRWIFTNADKAHAERVMSTLGIEDCFDGVVDIFALEPHCKPLEEAYHRALELAEVSDPKSCALLDDSAKNLAPAHQLGFFTVLVGRNGSHPVARRTLPAIHDLRRVVPEFWDHGTEEKYEG